MSDWASKNTESLNFEIVWVYRVFNGQFNLTSLEFNLISTHLAYFDEPPMWLFTPWYLPQQIPRQNVTEMISEILHKIKRQQVGSEPDYNINSLRLPHIPTQGSQSHTLFGYAQHISVHRGVTWFEVLNEAFYLERQNEEYTHRVLNIPMLKELGTYWLCWRTFWCILSHLLHVHSPQIYHLHNVGNFSSTLD